ncbi:reverse transcriptase [Operophtera brumata]|uniref:Reverse transcriptase n=1 Tax=Operophtera brumata TaxID=104452 RepID=A0A0L7KDT9_OPEBR|nr:reverse transcriptase [Operophtera brumata]KOB61252.1 reverse transcriptase [Operophtera brumata]
MQRNFAAMDHDRLLADASAIEWSQLFSTSDIDTKISIFNDTLTSLYDKHAPIKPVRMKRPPAPWLTEYIRKLMARRNHLYRDFALPLTCEYIQLTMVQEASSCGQA